MVGLKFGRAIRRALLLGTLKMEPIRGVHLVRQFSNVYNRGPEPTGLPGLFLSHLREKKVHHAAGPLRETPKRAARRSKK
jgi:hypothetical protein